MRMKCRECDQIHNSKDIRNNNILTYAVGYPEWHECIDGRRKGKEFAKSELDNDVTLIYGYDGCLGWP